MRPVWRQVFICRIVRPNQSGKTDGVAMPNNEYYEYYGPDYDLDVKASNMTDHNTPKYLEKLKQNVFEILRDKDAAPSVPLQRKLSIRMADIG